MKVEINSKRWVDLRDLRGEVWRVIEDTPENGTYLISNYGRLKRLAFFGGRYHFPDMVLRAHKNRKDGYYKVRVGKKMHYVHRLVAEAFLPNPNNYPEVDHINRVKEENRSENLRWVSHGTNMQNSSRGMAVARIDLLGRIVEQWCSIASAAKASGVSPVVMRSVIDKKGWIGVYRYRFA